MRTMKKLFTTIAGLILFFNMAAIAMAEYTVMPGAPHQRQYQFEIMPGKEDKATIIVHNLGNNTLTLELYAADATNSNLGTFALTTRSTEQKHIGTWITFDQPRITLAPRQEEELSFSIKVPTEAVPGNYAGGIAVEALSSSINPYNDDTAAPENVSVSARIISKLFVKIPGDKIQDYSWNNFDFINNQDNSRPYFSLTVKNDGNTIILGEPVINISGFPPPKESEIKLPLITIQPGREINNIEKRWDELPGFGIYTAEARIKFSELNVTTQEKLFIEEQVRSITINLTPDYIIVILLGAAALLLLSALTISIRKNLFRKKLVSYTVSSNETLADIAGARGVNWKKLAAVNNLKPPYNLKNGQTIVVPPPKKTPNH